MPQIYKTRTNPYLEKPRDRYQTLYSNKYGISAIIKYNQREDEDKSDLNALNEKSKEKLEKHFIEELKNYPKKSLEEILVNPQKEIKKPKEEYILNSKDNKLIFPFRYGSPSSHHINKKSKAFVFYVDPSALPQVEDGIVLGLYNHSTHSIYIANNLSKDEEEFVYYHEEYHSLHGKGEAQADQYAFERTGHSLYRESNYG